MASQFPKLIGVIRTGLDQNTSEQTMIDQVLKLGDDPFEIPRQLTT